MDQLFQKSISGPKQKKEYHRIMHIQTSVGINFHLKTSQNCLIPVWMRKGECNHRNFFYHISVATKFELKQFWIFGPKAYSRSEKEKMKITAQFKILKLD